MTSTGLLVLADDLTGACECALAAVQAGGRALVSLGPVGDAVDPAAWDLLAIDLDAREAPAGDAVFGGGDDALRVSCDDAFVAGAPVLKIDSTLRGAIGALVERFVAAVQPELLVVAPAFPGRGRVTRGGRQYVLGTADAPVDVRARVGAPGVEVVVLDASVDRDLDAGVAWGLATGRRIGWVGSAALVAALLRARGVPAPAHPVALDHGPVLVVIGSTTEETAVQVTELASRPDVAVCDAGDAAQVLAGGRHALLRGDSAPTLGRLVAMLAERAPLPRLLLSGGATARAVCDALGIAALEAIGDAGEGVPVARTLDGRHTVATKAGRFGPRDALAAAVDRLAGVAS